MSRITFIVLVALTSFAACTGQPKSADVEASKAQEADNTAQNVRDRDEATQTPVDQGGSEADVAITQAIRQAITASDSLSMNAKNIKIITLDGVVTLRGPVESSAEKAYIANVAQAVAGASKVDDQLEVVAARTSY